MADDKSEAIASDDVKQDNPAAGEDTANQGNPNPDDKKEATTSSKTAEELQAELDKQGKDLEQARRLQAQADRKAERERKRRIKAERKARGDDGHQDANDDDDDEDSSGLSNDTVERGRAEVALQRAALNPKYQKLIAENPTLQRMVERNPLALVDNPIDAEDAVYQLEDYLDGLLAQTSPAPTPKEEKKDTDAKPDAPRKVTQNPKSAPDKGYEKPLKKGDISGAVIGKMRNPANWNQGPQ